MDAGESWMNLSENHERNTLSVTVEHQNVENEVILSCYVCQSSECKEEKGQLKKFNDSTWATVQNVAALRKNLKSDKYLHVTQTVLLNTGNETLALGYHSSCHRSYTAVKRGNEDIESTCRIETRRSSSIPKSNEQGMLRGSCIFCGSSRKKKKGKDEPRLKVATIAGVQTIYDRANFSTNERIAGLARNGVDLIAKEAEYHKSCRLLFLKETKQDILPQKTSSKACHKMAFTSLLSFIEDEVLTKHRSIYVSELLDMYKEEYAATAETETESDILVYTAQNLTRKIKEHLKDRIIITMINQRKGNIIHSSDVPKEEAQLHLHENALRYEKNSKLRWAALHLRSQIMQLPKSKTPNPATVQNIKECSPEIPEELDLFFRYLLGGISHNHTHKDYLDRKVCAMGSDAIYNATRGAVKPWKHTALALGLSSLTGSKLVIQILNRTGHCINYSDTKGIETELAFSVANDERDAPDGICLNSNLATACVWDNYDANIETLDGKETLHATVGHTYQNVLQGDEQEINTNSVTFRVKRNRRSFVGKEKDIPAFKKSLRTARFISSTATDIAHITGAASTARTETFDISNETTVHLKVLDLYWFWKLMKGSTPLHAGFMSKYIDDPLPLQRICYMDPISRSPTNNDVVRETMTRTMNVADETGQEYGVVTYDLQVALKAYSIQAIETPVFDKLLVMLGHFHVELAFFGAVGTFINDSGIEFILSEGGVLAEGSIMGFIKGKFYNRCTRIHELLANVLEQKLYARFVIETPELDDNLFQEVMSNVSDDPEKITEHLSDLIVTNQLQKYEEFFKKVMNGNLGSTAQFWAIYIFMINRLHRELHRCVKTNDVSGYIEMFPTLLAVFFALNRPNYARWGTLFLHKLKCAHPKLRDILENGAFSIRRTKKSYSRSAVDLSLEQTVNRDSASRTRGVVSFRNSESAMRRWSLNMTQRATAVTELRVLVGLELGDTVASQCRPSRVKKDNSQMEELSLKIDDVCNPFSQDAPTALVNLATGQVATTATETYLLTTLDRGQIERDKFQDEWSTTSSRFLQPVKRTCVQNFAAQNIKRKATASQKARTNAESLRDLFVRMLIVVSENTKLDLKKIISFPITSYPLSLAHSDGTHMKTDKSALLRKLESFQTEPVSEDELPASYAQIYDGGLLLHSSLSLTAVGASYSSIARMILSMVCSGRANEVHVCFDKYVENSIKSSERKQRDAVDTAYTITGPDQTIRQSGKKLLTNGTFKDELAKFLLKEWRKTNYCQLFRGKTLFASYGGECFQYVPGEDDITVCSPSYLQGDHEEADTLIAFHAANVSEENVVVRASDTDVLVILIGAIGRQIQGDSSLPNIIMDCGIGNSRRFINVTNIADILEERKPRLASALPGYHAFTGCDFTSAFYRKGKSKPLSIIEKELSDTYVNFFIDIGNGNDLELDVASEFVCRIYAVTKTKCVNEARYHKLLQMTGKVGEGNPLANIKRVDCSLLPPSLPSLMMKVRRTQYVTRMWTRALTNAPGDGLSPTNYGWYVDNGLLKPTWFEGRAVPDSLFTEDITNLQEIESDDDDNNADMETENELVNLLEEDVWSEDSDDGEEDDI